MQQDPAPLDMPQESRAQAGTFVRSFDQTGNVGQNEFLLPGPDHAEVGMQGGEGIVGDLGPGARHPRQKGGLAGIGEADQAGIGDQLEAQPDPKLLPGLAGVGPTWRAIGRGLEGRVPQAAAPPAGQGRPLSDLRQIREDEVLVLVQHLGADRHLYHQFVAAGTGPVAPLAVGTAPRLEMLAITEIDQGVQPLNSLDHHIAALAAVAAVRAAELHVLLAAKRTDAVAAVSRLHIDLGFIEELHGEPGRSDSPKRKRGSDLALPRP